MDTKKIPDRFLPALDALKTLARRGEYEGVVILGSVGRGDTASGSDLDVIVVAHKRAACKNLSHPLIAGIELDINYLTFQQLKRRVIDGIRGGRHILIKDAFVLFDTNGRLATLMQRISAARPKKAPKKEYYWIRTLLSRSVEKIERYAENDPVAASVAMNCDISFLLELHYQICGRWMPDSEKILFDLKEWDGALSQLLEKFAVEDGFAKRYDAWKTIAHHIAKPLGGLVPTRHMNCTCAICIQNYKILLEK